MKRSTTLLSDARKELGLSAADVATVLGVHPQTVNRWEARRRLPGPTHIRELARVLNLEVGAVAAFFDDVRQPAADNGLPGHNLRVLRRERRVRTDVLASACGVHTSTIYNWELSRARIPRRALPSLAGALRLTERSLQEALAIRIHRPENVVVRDQPLRRRRKRARLTQAAVARQVGATRKQISNWECGQPPPIFMVRRLARFYAVSVSTMARDCGVRFEASLDPADWAAVPFGETVRALRVWCGISQRELAALLDRQPVTVRAWEAGRSAPRPRLRREMEQLFNVPAGSLVIAGTQTACPRAVLAAS